METITTRKTEAGAVAYIRSQGREPGAWVPGEYFNGRETLAVETVWDVEPYDNGTFAVVSEMRLASAEEPETYGIEDVTDEPGKIWKVTGPNSMHTAATAKTVEERMMNGVREAVRTEDVAEEKPHRLVVAQDNETTRVLVTYTAPDGRKTTERVSSYLADLLRDNGLLIKSKPISHDPEARCEWYGLCPNPVAGHVAHPVLGNVPTCQLCADRFELPLVAFK